MNCGRTLIGKLPTRSQPAELNYFAPIPDSVQELLFYVQAMILKLGVPMAVLRGGLRAAGCVAHLLPFNILLRQQCALHGGHGARGREVGFA